MFHWLHGLHKWAPFKIDALGLVTLLGQEQVNAKIGRLVREGYLDFMPLLGAFVIAGDLFVDRQAGFSIYNITSGITTPEMAGWLTRWLKAQQFDKDEIRKDVTWKVETDKRSYAKMNWIAFMIAFVLQGGLLVFTILMADGYGIANSLSMAASVFVRIYVLKQCRDAIDQAVETGRANAVEKKRKNPASDLMREVTILCVLDDATALIMKTPEYLVVECFVKTPEPPNPWRYLIARSLGWIFFLVHIIAIGQSVLISQMVTVILLVVPTVTIVALPESWRKYLGCNESYIAKTLTAEKTDTKALGKRRIHLYAMCQLIRTEEESMLHWSTMPHSSNKEWWAEYREEKQKYLVENPKAGRPEPTQTLTPSQSTGSLLQPVTSHQSKNTQLILPPAHATGTGNIPQGIPRTNTQGTTSTVQNTQGHHIPGNQATNTQFIPPPARSNTQSTSNTTQSPANHDFAGHQFDHKSPTQVSNHVP